MHRIIYSVEAFRRDDWQTIDKCTIGILALRLTIELIVALKRKDIKYD